MVKRTYHPGEGSPEMCFRHARILPAGCHVGIRVWVLLPAASIHPALLLESAPPQPPFCHFAVWATEVPSCSNQGTGCNSLVSGERVGRSFGGWGKDGSRQTAGQSVTVGIVWSVVSSEGLDASKEGRQKGDQVGRANEAPRCQRQKLAPSLFLAGLQLSLSPCPISAALGALLECQSVHPFPISFIFLLVPPLPAKTCRPSRALSCPTSSLPLPPCFHLCLFFLSLDTTSLQGLGLCPHP